MNKIGLAVVVLVALAVAVVGGGCGSGFGGLAGLRIAFASYRDGKSETEICT